jgi:DNA-binding transcriptional LysR family regulator
MNTVDILKYGQQTVLSTLEGFPATGENMPGACGRWSVKDIIAHLASYEQLLIEVLSGFLGNGPTLYMEKMGRLGALEFNDSEVAARQEQTLAEVLTEFNEAHTQVMALAPQIPAETYRHNGTLPWYGPEYDLDDFIVYTFYGHKREHSAQIAAFRDWLTEKEG